MAAFTPTGVKLGSGAISNQLDTSEAIIAGQVITGTGYIVDVNDSDKFGVIGLVVADAISGGKAVFVASGEVVVTNTLTPQRQIIAAPSGQLQYDDDLLSGDGYVIVGYTKDANTIVILPKNTELIKA